ncbi:hypothetical protein V6M85_02995 [Sulfolobus tengchongensis]|uniref:Uncharacterized protein n=1 Tax=Sulfolobus tengchongensis TaxID=207809 RepID=A0AAX4L1R2_9CREN
MIYRLRNVKEGTIALTFDKVVDVYDDEGNPLNSWFDGEKLYVRVDKRTDLFLIETDNPINDPYEVFELYYDSSHKNQFELLDGSDSIENSKNTIIRIISKKEVEAPFTMEVEAYYEGEADNQIIGFLSERNFSTHVCHGKFLGGYGDYYAKGYAVAFNPNYSKKVLFLTENDCVNTNIDIPRGNYKLTIYVEKDKTTLTINGQPLISPIPNKTSGYIYFSGNTGELTSKQKLIRIKVIKDLVDYITEKPRHVGFSNIKLKNFKGISEGELSNLDLCNVILGSNNAGKTTLLEGFGSH